MKTKITITDLKGKTITKEVTIRQKDQFDALKKHRSQTFRNKKAYTRKIKHKGRFNAESSF